MINPDHYVYKVIWSVEDQEYVGLCAEYPSLSYLPPSHDCRKNRGIEPGSFL